MAEQPDTDSTPVLIVGAGPTGLVLAIWLTRLGVPVRIIDEAAQPATSSRALAVQARTLEFYAQLGLADAVISAGRLVSAGNLWAAGAHVGRIVFGDMGDGLSPYPRPAIFPQDAHERLLIEHLRGLGVIVERHTELAGFAEDGGRVHARLQHADGSTETCTAVYIAGCDGAHSTLRQALRIAFAGGTYEHVFYVADVAASGPAMNGEVHVALDPYDFLAVFPLKQEGSARLVGTVRDDASGVAGRALAWPDVSHRVLERLQIEVARVNWFSTYHVHHRVADHFRRGRAFLLGDAAHVHSPVGGQGMNTGIGDAVNLAWKLAAVLGGRAPPALLDSYETERIGFARQLVATTDRAFTGITSSGALARRLRLTATPLLLPFLVRFGAVRHAMFRILSQTALRYRESPLSEGRAGAIHGGDRLPWVPAADQDDNFAPLRALDWQVHVYGTASDAIVDLCNALQLALHVFDWTSTARSAGLLRDALYLVRPDGYVALANAGADPNRLRSYLRSRGFVREVRPAG